MAVHPTPGHTQNLCHLVGIKEYCILSNGSEHWMRGNYAVIHLRESPRCRIGVGMGTVEWIRDNGLREGTPPCGGCWRRACGPPIMRCIRVYGRCSHFSREEQPEQWMIEPVSPASGSDQQSFIGKPAEVDAFIAFVKLLDADVFVVAAR